MNDQLKQAALEAYRKRYRIPNWASDEAIQEMPNWSGFFIGWQLATQAAYERAAQIADARVKLYDECKESVNDEESEEMYSEKAAVSYCIAKEIRSLSQGELEAPAPVTAAPDGWIYEDELPEAIDKSDYDRWYAMSRVIDGVRMGPKWTLPAAPKVEG